MTTAIERVKKYLEMHFHPNYLNRNDAIVMLSVTYDDGNTQLVTLQAQDVTEVVQALEEAQKELQDTRDKYR